MALRTNTPSSAGRNRFGSIMLAERYPQPSLAASRPPTEHLDGDQYAALLGFIEREGGLVTLDNVSRAFPTVESPVSAVFDLCDAGVLCADLAAAFCGDMFIWRKDD